MPRPARDYGSLVGKKKNFLTCLEVLPPDAKRKEYPTYWAVRCVCECGNEKILRVDYFTLGRVKTCGATECSNACRKQSKKTEVNFDLPANTLSIAELHLNPKWRCGCPDLSCSYSEILGICCRECDKQDNCGKACKNEPCKCGAKKRQEV